MSTWIALGGLALVVWGLVLLGVLRGVSRMSQAMNAWERYLDGDDER